MSGRGQRVFNFPLIGQAQGGNNVGLMRHEYGDNSCYTGIWYIIGSSSFFVFFVCWEKSAPLQSSYCSSVDHLPFKTSGYIAGERSDTIYPINAQFP